MPYPYNAADGREDRKGAGQRIMRGASWVATFSGGFRGSQRYRDRPEVHTHALGLRCARSI